MKKGSKIAIFSILAVALIAVLTIFDQKQTKAISKKIELTNHCIMIIAKQENALSHLNSYWLQYGDAKKREASFNLMLAFGEEKETLSNFKNGLEKMKDIFFVRIIKGFSTIDYQFYNELLSMQNNALFTTTRNAAIGVAGKIIENKKLIEDSSVKKIIDDITEAARILKEAKADLEELELILKSNLPS